MATNSNVTIPSNDRSTSEKSDGGTAATSHDSSPFLSSHITARQAFFGDLKNLIAVGSIRLLKRDGILYHTDESFYPNPHIEYMLAKSWIVVNVTTAPQPLAQVYILPEDVGRKFRQGSIAEFRKYTRSLMSEIDATSWDSYHDAVPARTHYQSMLRDESLFYIFNTLQSPDPSPSLVYDDWTQQAVKDLLGSEVTGLRTPLYAYQQRSAAMMVQRETYPKRSPDPRKPLHRGPTGQAFYFDREEGILLQHPHLYEESRGGILAETMGYGKTLICLATILATRGHFPSIPEGRIETAPAPRGKVASLLIMAAAKVGRSAVPWKADFQKLERQGENYERCVDELKKHVREYDEPIFNPTTPNRKGKREANKIVKLCSATLVVVPSNLLNQWQREITKHVDEGVLDVLVIDASTKNLPQADELMRYDVVLITKSRFEQEYRDNDLHLGKRGRGEETFQSPLTELRWLRVIVDEGHGFAGSASKTNALAMLDKMYIERRWVVSGTPANTLLGVEVGLAVNESSENTDPKHALESRRAPDALDQEIKDIERLRTIVVKFLKVLPWANAKGADHANWKRYLSPMTHSFRRRQGACLRTLLQSLIVRHRIEDVKSDLTLPPLYNKVMYLEPSYHDKLSMNIFVAALISNAVTSERTDEDYMFHSKNRRNLDLLINNTRQSSFHWVGWKRKDLEEIIRISTLYLDDNFGRISNRDNALLEQAVAVSQKALADQSWNAFSDLHQIGVYAEGFPAHSAQAWSLSKEHIPGQLLLVGTQPARAAQRHVLEHINDVDPAEALNGAGLRAMMEAKKQANGEDDSSVKGVAEEPKLKDQTSTVRVSSTSLDPIFSKRKNASKAMLDPTSELANTAIVGFSSTKLSYLVDRILELQREEKTIIFYDSNNVAFWIAEALELLSVRFLIYSNTLTVSRRATYLATFNQKETFRVLLMDLKQAAHGLHIASASRVFIVSPIWQPNIESQAIKRAHRIGQTRPVYVETLVLQDTLEDRMLKRRKQMSNLELQNAEKSLLDDSTMNQIIQNEAFIPFRDDENVVENQAARLKIAQPMFDRSTNTVSAPLTDEDLVSAESPATTPNADNRPRRKKRVKLVAGLDGHWSDDEEEVLGHTDWPMSPFTRQSNNQLSESQPETATDRRIFPTNQQSSQGASQLNEQNKYGWDERMTQLILSGDTSAAAAHFAAINPTLPSASESANKASVSFILND